MADSRELSVEERAALLDAGPDPIVVVGRDGRIVLVNTEAERTFGCTRENLVDQPVAVFVPALHAAVRAASAAPPRTVAMIPGAESRRKDGTQFLAEIRLSAIEGDGGVIVASIRDLAERTKVESKFRRIVEAAPDALVLVNAQGVIQLINAQTEKLFGYGRDELVGESIEKLVPERFHDEHSADRAALSADADVRTVRSGRELYGRRKDGTEFSIEISLSPIETEEGLFVSSAIRDVTDRKKADETKLRLAAIIDSSDDAIIGQSLDGIIASWNGGAERIFGYAAADAIGRHVSFLFPPELEFDEADVLNRVRSGVFVGHFDTVRRRKDGRDIDVSVTISPVRDSSGKLVGASKVARDISARKRIETSLARAKDEAEMANRELESFSYSVAHDLRTPLRAIDGFSQALLEDHSDKLDEEGRSFLRTVRQSTRYMAQLIDDLLALARVSRSAARRDPVDLSQLAEAAVARLRSAHPQRGVDVTIAPNLIATGDATLLSLVLDNLIGNAWKFSARCPKPHIVFGRAEEPGPPTFFVRDNGAGFDMAYADKLFGVFQRLHGATEYEGTGIGLATVQRIVRRHGGRVWAEGQVGRGAVFFFTLPDGEEQP